VARSATEVVRVAAIPLLIWLFAATVRTTPAVACGRGFPLSKEGNFRAEFCDRKSSRVRQPNAASPNPRFPVSSVTLKCARIRGFGMAVSFC